MKNIHNITESDRRHARVSRLANEMKITRSVLQDAIDAELAEQSYFGESSDGYEKALKNAINKLLQHDSPQ